MRKFGQFGGRDLIAPEERNRLARPDEPMGSLAQQDAVVFRTEREDGADRLGGLPAHDDFHRHGRLARRLNESNGRREQFRVAIDQLGVPLDGIGLAPIAREGQEMLRAIRAAHMLRQECILFDRIVASRVALDVALASGEIGLRRLDQVLGLKTHGFTGQRR